MAPRILLIVYIHGFKGDHTTFATFPNHLTALLSHRLPHLSIRHQVFPTFETRGDLDGTVQKFRAWLEEQVIDLEVEIGTPSPTVDPGVGVLVIGHSMGGIVGAEAVLGIAGERVLPTAAGSAPPDEVHGQDQNEWPGRDGWSRHPGEQQPLEQKDETSNLLFPYIQGLMAFDTPYLGLSPGIVAHGVEGHWKESKAWYETATGVFGALAGGAAAKEAVDPAPVDRSKGALPAPSPGVEEQNTTGTKSPTSWSGKWGKTALLASAGLAATTALGTTAYLKRETISTGFTWISSHLEFVGCLARGEELRLRLERMQSTSHTRHIGFTDFYTLLAPDKGGGEQGRPFCNLPKRGSKLWEVFRPMRNVKAPDEVSAHVGVFRPKENPGYYAMSDEVLELVVAWVQPSSPVEGSREDPVVV